MSLKSSAALLSLSPRAEREYNRSLRAGLSSDAALACAKFVERERKSAKGPPVFIPRWRVQGGVGRM
jgi:hypothetical protein